MPPPAKMARSASITENVTIAAMRKKKTTISLWLLLPGLILAAWLVYQIPPVHRRLAWRVEVAMTYLRGVINPAGPMPTPLPTPTDDGRPTTVEPPTPTAIPTIQPTVNRQPSTATLITVTDTPTPLPPSIALSAPAWEQQDMNNCGPASLSMYLRYYGWEGDQYDISNVIKPIPEDRNVNPEEMVYWVRNYAGWLNATFRVGGDLDLLKRLLAAGFPVMIEESFYFDDPYWPNDDLWAAHYLLLTGYDDASQVFLGQDSYHGPNQKVAYARFDEDWRIFNRLMILVYSPAGEPTLREIFGSDWDENTNRQHALDTAQSETQANPDDAFAWFNLGSNLVYFERYSDAADAYDAARNLSLPQRMLRYQFGPFFAYFQSQRIDDLLALTDYALQRTPNSEEALLWHGWALYRKGDLNGAIGDWRSALKANPNSADAKSALDFVGASP